MHSVNYLIYLMGWIKCILHFVWVATKNFNKTILYCEDFMLECVLMSVYHILDFFSISVLLTYFSDFDPPQIVLKCTKMHCSFLLHKFFKSSGHTGILITTKIQDRDLTKKFNISHPDIDFARVN